MDSPMIDNASSNPYATATTPYKHIDYGSSLNNNNGPDTSANVIQPEHFDNNYNNDFSSVNAIIDNPGNNDNGLDRLYSNATNVNQPGQPVNYNHHTNTQFVSSPPINSSNNGFPSNFSNNNNGFDIIYDANLTQPGQSVPCDQYSLHTNTSMVQYNAPQLVSPPINLSNPSNIPNNNNNDNNGFDIAYNATNVTQSGQSVPCDQYSLHTNTSMTQYNAPQLVTPPINPSNNGSPSDIFNNNNNGFDIIYNATNGTQSGQSVPYDNYNLYATTSVAQHYNVVTDSLQSVFPIPSQTQTNDSRIFRLMIPGFQIIVIPNNNA